MQKTGYSVQFEPRTHALFMNLAVLIGARYARKWFLPAPIRAVCTVVSFLRFARAALNELSRSRLTVPVLDIGNWHFFRETRFRHGIANHVPAECGRAARRLHARHERNELISSLLDVPDKAQK